ncbi:F-box domain, Leucine-rich repeat domain, L domain-like protein [Artemisia annua]|uniref:F-box domain, Leucine-rich repeat domain, L domain-like protein n=1 Tax=Artemisia annua TaxID=35608 RepID=A0A2U1MH62_ARTAN|nr:F-box domain, Leucine-rich repeat domain, L domain-like protein [Artemisia annua]
MSMLSKYWFAVSISFPISGFNILEFYDVIKPSSRRVNWDEHNRYVRDCFFKYVDDTTSRFCHQNVTVHTFKLITPNQDCDPTQVDIIDRCLGLFLTKGVKVLVIEIKDIHFYDLPKYRLPNTLLSASSLTSMKIFGCELPPSLMVDVVNFKSLKMLELKRVPLHDEVIKRLTTSCPLLEKITINDCEGVKIFCVYGLQNLQEVKIEFGDAVLEIIDIDAPNLWHLWLVDSGRGMPSMKVASCKKLTKLSYNGYPSPTSEGLVDLSSDFPFLEELYLELDDPRSLQLSSHSVRTFELCTDLDLDVIDLSAPNLLLFMYNDYSRFDFGVKRDSIPSKACMAYEGFVDRYWFQYLRQFLDKNIGFKELKLSINVRRIEVEELMVIQSPRYELEHVELYIKELSVYESILDAVLWCCRPHSLTLEANFACTNSLILKNGAILSRYIIYLLYIMLLIVFVFQFTHEKLLLQEDEGKTNIGILISSSSKVQKHFSDLNSFLTASPRDLQVETITFIKEEVVPIKKKRMIKQSKDINTDVPNCSKSFQITVNGLDEFFDTWSPMHLVGMDVEALKIIEMIIPADVTVDDVIITDENGG